MKILFTLVFSLFISVAQATTLDTLFEDHFFSLHVPGRCGQNILKFLDLAKRENIDLTGAEIINVEGGWVEPQYVRNGGYTPKIPGPAGLTYSPAPRYYYFHVFLIHDGKVYDFDYGNSPVIPSFKTYFKKMWIRGKEGDKYLGLQVYKAEDYLRGGKRPDAPMINLLEFVRSRN